MEEFGPKWGLEMSPNSVLKGTPKMGELNPKWDPKMGELGPKWRPKMSPKVGAEMAQIWPKMGAQSGGNGA